MFLAKLSLNFFSDIIVSLLQLLSSIFPRSSMQSFFEFDLLLQDRADPRFSIVFLCCLGRDKFLSSLMDGVLEVRPHLFNWLSASCELLWCWCNMFQ